MTAKVPTTPGDQSEGVVAAVLEALGAAGLGPADVARFGHGMTVGTNALLEGTGARTSLVPPRASATCWSCAVRRAPRSTASTSATRPP